PGAQIGPIVGGELLLVEFLEHGFEVAETADGPLSGVVTPGGILAGTTEQDSVFEALDREAPLEPVAGQDFIGGGEDGLDASPCLEQFLEGGDKRLGSVVGFFRFGLPVGPVGLGDFDSAAAGWTAAEVATTDTAGFHLAQVMADGRAAFFQMARQFGLSGFQD